MADDAKEEALDMLEQLEELLCIANPVREKLSTEDQIRLDTVAAFARKKKEQKQQSKRFIVPSFAYNIKNNAVLRDNATMLHDELLQAILGNRAVADVLSIAKMFEAKWFVDSYGNSRFVLKLSNKEHPDEEVVLVCDKKPPKILFLRAWEDVLRLQSIRLAANRETYEGETIP